jgi:protein-L-isoaspartate(D-aspartate) O-methyltransferase
MLKNELIKILSEESFNKKILSAFQKVKRENFVPAQYKKFAYENIALSIGYGQTISQPYTIAFMLSLLEVLPRQKIMEIGSGSGYVLALLNELSPESIIYGVEIIPELLKIQKKNLKNYENIKINLARPEQLGLLEDAPFDRILVSAAAIEIPDDLLEQLADSGILVCPVKKSILKFKKKNGIIEKENYYGFNFVPLIY